MLDKIVQTGRLAALAAGAVLRQNYLKPHRVMLKGAIDPVTETDLQSQETIINIIRQAFPDHGFLAEEDKVGAQFIGTEVPGRDESRSSEGREESGARAGYKNRGEPCVRPGANTRLAPTGDLEGGGGGQEVTFPGPPLKSTPSSPYRWIIDPLDGTVNFAHGFPMFCVSIAFEAEGVLQYGVIFDPLRDELFEAVQGQGATLNGQPIRVSATDRLDRALLATGFPYDIRERLPETLARLGRMLGVAQGVRRAGSAALDMAYVACGRFDGFWEEHLKPWDTAAGCLLIEEAGGRITTFSGGDYDIYAPNIVATNGILHERLISCLNPEALQSDGPSRVLEKPFYVGADGCKGGWFSIALTKEGYWQTGVFQDIAALWEKYHNADLILMDVPIGLREKGAEERHCDVRARQVLGQPRGSSVFPVPCRPAIHEENAEVAKARNKKLTGKGLSPCALGILPKIREVDIFLRNHEAAQRKIREVHPEVCFWALAGDRPMQRNKKIARGFEERLNVLRQGFNKTDEIVTHALNNYRRNKVAKDDILDALAAAITAASSPQNLLTLPENPEKDTLGLPMEMVYRKLTPS